ncbi:MAG TPA: hypothetical protein VFY39_11190 [Gammaproteobacteria bacterium]|nr:hypothetical protein [Gammaproteobacteria bacterium]
MEIVLQWLDDLDDLVFLSALASERGRCSLLGVGLSASAAAILAAELNWLPVLLACVALGTVAIWSAGAAAVLKSRLFTGSSA